MMWGWLLRWLVRSWTQEGRLSSDILFWFFVFFFFFFSFFFFLFLFRFSFISHISSVGTFSYEKNGRYGRFLFQGPRPQTPIISLCFHCPKNNKEEKKERWERGILKKKPNFLKRMGFFFFFFSSSFCPISLPSSFPFLFFFLPFSPILSFLFSLSPFQFCHCQRICL